MESNKKLEFKIPYEFRNYIQNLKAHESMPTEKLYTKIKFLSGRSHMNPDKNSQN